jgi:hypothetical protein
VTPLCGYAFQSALPSDVASATVDCILLLTREGHHMNHKRFRRLYREEKLQVRRRGGRSGRWACGATKSPMNLFGQFGGAASVAATKTQAK